MGLYKGKTATEGGMAQYKPGAFKFKITSVKHYDAHNSIEMIMDTWAEDNTKGPQLHTFLNLSGKDALLAETDRRLTVIMGKPELDRETDLIGKAGWVMLRKGPKYIEAMPFAGFFTTDKKSATGKAESFDERKKEAIAYDWTTDEYALKKATKETPKASAEDSETTPF